MTTFKPQRIARGGWITRQLADMADIRTPADLLAFLLCAAAVVTIAVMALNPRGTYLFCMAVADRIAEVMGWA